MQFKPFGECKMPSIQSRLLYFTLRNRHYLKFQLKREAWDWDTSIPGFREQCERGAKKTARLPEGIEVRPAAIDVLPAGLRAEWILPPGAGTIPGRDLPVLF